MIHITKKIILILSLYSTLSYAANDVTKVMIMKIDGTIDSRTTHYVELALHQAQREKAQYIILHVDTFGGTLDDANDVVDMLLESKIPIWAFINKDAASAGALIAIACDSIYMSPGSSIGAATVVTGEGEVAPDKYQSYMRSIMRSTAEVKNRNAQIAEGMVDKDVEIRGVTKKGKIITFTVSEAITHGYCEGKVRTPEEILAQNNIMNYEIFNFELDTVESIIAFFINPFISSLLILLILGGLYFELQSPGIGFPLVVSAIALILYLVPYYINGLANYWEIIALFAGFVLVGLDVFFFSGLGLIGGVMIIGSMALIMLNNDFFDFEMVPSSDVVLAFLSIFSSLIVGAILLFVYGARISRWGLFKKVLLTQTQDTSKGYTVNTHTEKLIGKIGTTHTVLRPSGKITIDDKLYDAFSHVDFLDKGTPVEIIGIEGFTLKVRKHSQ